MILTWRDRQICALLLQGCDNPAIAKELKMSHRTVKAHLHKLYLLFGIRSGVKRIHLAVVLYRRAEEWLDLGPEHGTLLLSKHASRNLSQADLGTGKSPSKSNRQSKSLRTTSEVFMTKLESGRAWNLLYGMKRELIDLAARIEKLEAVNER